MKRLQQLKNDAIFGIVVGSCFLLSFVGGCSAKIIYQVNNQEWLNSVIVAAFEGLFFCTWGLLGVLASKKRWTQTNRFDYKVAAILIFLFFSILPLFVGLYILWIATGNFFELLQV